MISMTVSFFTFDLFLKYKHKLYGNIFIDLFLFFFFNVILLYILYFLFITLFDLLGFSPCSNLYLESNYESNTNLESSSKEFSISKVILNNNVIYDFKNRILEKELIEALKTIANLALYIWRGVVCGTLGKTFIHSKQELPPLRRGLLGVIRAIFFYGEEPILIIINIINIIFILYKSYSNSNIILDVLNNIISNKWKWKFKFITKLENLSINYNKYSDKFLVTIIIINYILLIIIKILKNEVNVELIKLLY